MSKHIEQIEQLLRETMTAIEYADGLDLSLNSRLNYKLRMEMRREALEEALRALCGVILCTSCKRVFHRETFDALPLSGASGVQTRGRMVTCEARTCHCGQAIAVETVQPVRVSTAMGVEPHPRGIGGES